MANAPESALEKLESGIWNVKLALARKQKKEW